MAGKHADNIARSLELCQETRAARVAFLTTELATALTFARTALDATDSTERRKRNLANARKAYDAFVHFSNGADLEAIPGEVRQNMKEQLQELRTTLQQLESEP